MDRQATRWPNRLGWDVRVEHGEAEVRNLGPRLRAFVPVAPRREWFERKRKWLYIPRYKVCDVPPGTDPLEAVRLCLKDGLLCEEGYPIEGTVPLLTPEPALFA